MTTNEMDKTTADERNALRGFCETCRLWTEFIRGIDKELCGNCGGHFTEKHGLQITTQRSPLPAKNKVVKAGKIGA